jgi:hypothetical protein
MGPCLPFCLLLLSAVSSRGDGSGGGWRAERKGHTGPAAKYGNGQTDRFERYGAQRARGQALVSRSITVECGRTVTLPIFPVAVAGTAGEAAE